MIVSTVVVWGLSGLYYMVIVKDMMAVACKPFKDAGVMRSMDDLSPAIWLIPTFLLSWFLLRILTQVPGLIAASRGAVWGITMALVFCIVHEIGWYMTFIHYDLQMSLMTCGWEIVQWGIGGALMAVVYSKLYKA